MEINLSDTRTYDGKEKQCVDNIALKYIESAGANLSFPNSQLEWVGCYVHRKFSNGCVL